MPSSLQHTFDHLAVVRVTTWSYARQGQDAAASGYYTDELVQLVHAAYKQHSDRNAATLPEVVVVAVAVSAGANTPTGALGNWAARPPPPATAVPVLGGRL